MWQALQGFDWWWGVKFLLAFLVVLALIAGFFYGLRRFGAGALAGATGGRGRQPRLAVIETSAIDSRRQLWLIRRDNVEHLIMTGGPTDIVIEPASCAPLRPPPPASLRPSG